MIKSFNILFIGLIAFSIASTCPTGEPVGLPKSTISYVVDDYIDDISINKNSLFLQENEKSKGVGLAQIQLYLFPGDIISFTMRNGDVWSTWNPAFLLASINYYDNKGGNKVFSTGSDWQCDGIAPQILGQNKDFQGSTYWKNTQSFSQIELTAKLIWNPDHRMATVCSFKIPCN